jgi:prepilin-type N-terminal cleavage/methylation domain-containing protein
MAEIHRSVRYSRLSGFTLVEIMVVIAIIGVLAVLAIPGFRIARIRSQNTAFINDMRIIEGAINTCVLEAKTYPADMNAKIMPPELASHLARMDWTKTTPIGGYWDYYGKVAGITCGIGVYCPGRSADEMAEIDAKIDDGNLAAGLFRQVSPEEYVSIIVP